MNSAKSQWKRESGRATCRRSAQTRWRMASLDVGRRGSTIIAFLSNNVAAELNYCQEYHIYLCLSKHFHLPDRRGDRILSVPVLGGYTTSTAEWPERFNNEAELLGESAFQASSLF